MMYQNDQTSTSEETVQTHQNSHESTSNPQQKYISSPQDQETQPPPTNPGESPFSDNSSCVDSITNESTIKSRLIDILYQSLIVNFTPAYFVPSMGCGIASSILRSFVYPNRWMEVCGIIMWSFGIFFFLSSLICFIISIIKLPNQAQKFNNDPNIALYMGCLPMGFTSLLMTLHLILGDRWIIGVWVLWWIDIFASLYTACFTVFFSLITKYSGTKNLLPFEELHAILLLPVVTLTVVSSLGALITPSLPNLNLQVITITVSFIVWSICMSLGYNIILTIYFGKLFIYKAPPTRLVFTSFLPIGLLGQSGFAILLLGQDISDIIIIYADSLSSSPYISQFHNYPIKDYNLLSVILSSIFLITSGVISLFFIAFAWFLTMIAVLTCLSKIPPFTKVPNQEFNYQPHAGSHFLKRKFSGLIKFNLSYWSMTFPLGTVALSTGQFFKTFNGFKAMRIVSVMYAVTVLIIVICSILAFFYKVALLAIFVIKGENDIVKENKKVMV